jgi:hypothetical protein
VSSTGLTLTSGTHEVQVRAVHQSGRTVTSTARTVVADTTAPAFTTKPNLALRTGTVTTTAVPLTLGWKVTTADLKSATTLYRNAIWTRTWPTSTKHTLKITVKATADRPTITTDGIVYLR